NWFEARGAPWRGRQEPGPRPVPPPAAELSWRRKTLCWISFLSPLMVCRLYGLFYPIFADGRRGRQGSSRAFPLISLPGFSKLIDMLAIARGECACPGFGTRHQFQT